MERFNWAEMRRYWEKHTAVRAPLDLEHDPDALCNVCHPGGPLWLNERYALEQRAVFERLLAMLPKPDAGPRALDVGCGGGRWTRLLRDWGYNTTGVDLQPDLIAANTRRYPDITYVQTAVQDYSPAAPFDLVTSVTVIQHMPFETQVVALRHIRDLLRPGGHALFLENVSDQAAHVFSRSISGWQRVFADVGFQTLTVQRYDYNPLLRTHDWVISQLAARTEGGKARKPEAFLTPGAAFGTSLTSRLKPADDLLRKGLAAADSLVESRLVAANLPLGTAHCGFLLLRP
jgi:2-polyprenyl-3-methyl-5-hydroxy-6-metoxy-1,4-benzoquinol methylase